MAVSSTSVKGFKPYKSLAGVDEPATLNFIIDNSQTMTIGDAVRLDTGGYIKRAISTDAGVLGIVQGFYDSTGQVGVFSPRMPQNALAGATLTPDDTIATASDNTSNTAKQLVAAIIMDPAGDILYENLASAALSQSNIGALFNILTSNPGQIDVASVSNTAAQFQLVSLDPDNDGNTSKGLFRIVQSQLVGGIQTYGSTTVRAA